MPEYAKITILIADDYAVTRAGIRSILSDTSDMEIVGEAQNGYEVKKLVARLQPKILLLDLVMPGPTPTELEKWVRKNYPDIITLVLTGHNRDAYLAGMMDAGVKGFMDKRNVHAEQLIAAIRRAARGESLFDEIQKSRVLRWQREVEEKWKSLSDRERKILQLLQQGLSNQQIAESMNINSKTVEQHLTSLYDKIGVTTRAKATLWVNSQCRDFPD